MCALYDDKPYFYPPDRANDWSISEMTDAPSPKPFGPRDRALETLEQVRQALTNNNLQEAIRQIETLQANLTEWKRSEARDWLDAALRSDVLLFNVETAKQRLVQWKSVLKDEDESEFNHYQDRVNERIKQKQIDLQARGIIAHCQELWRQAATLERGDQPPHPDFVLSNYYNKARDIILAASAEHPDNPNLDVALQQAQLLCQSKVTARQIYKLALESNQYGEALDKLTSLENIDIIPRYWITQDQSAEMTRFERMISTEEARTELERLARAWASDQAGKLQQQVEELLQIYRPKTALEAVAQRQKLERFLNDGTRQKLYALENRARDDVNMLEQSERRATQAAQIAAENPLQAWATYTEAYRIYAGTPSLTETREQILSQMASQLQQMIETAEHDFEKKRMERITETYQRARLDYSDKDPSLEELLATLAEIEQQARLYQDYLRNAYMLLQQIRTQLDDDIIAAGETLTELEDYPGIVLEELSDLPELRNTVRHRLNMELLYNQLFKLMYSSRMEDIENGIATASKHSEDARMQQLRLDLETHRVFLVAQHEFQRGNLERSLAVLERVIRQDDHPDHEAARQLYAEIEDELRAEEDTVPNPSVTTTEIENTDAALDDENADFGEEA